MTTGSTYRDAGVDIDAATEAVASIRELAEATRANTGAGSLGHFGGLYRLPAGDDQLLVASADGVGTKLMLAFRLGGDAHAQVGSDLVCHCVGDLLACGARPLFFLDYFATGKLDKTVFATVLRGLSSACAANGLALIGGETAEMPGLYADGHYDLAGFIVGTVAPDRFIDGSQIRAGDVLLGLPAPGLNTNGYSLARKVLGLRDGDRPIAPIDVPRDDLDGATIAEALMAGHPSYFDQVWPLLEANLVTGMAHITGGGLLDNVPRMLPDGLCAHFDLSSWSTPLIFELLVREGEIPPQEAYRAFNMGLGFVLAVRPEDVESARLLSPDAVVVGYVDGCGDQEQRVLGLTSADQDGRHGAG